jgi:predicted choloylglycine hydrolase
MKRASRILAIIILLAAAAHARAETNLIAEYGAGKKEYVDGVRVVRLSGTPREIGVQHGNLLKDEIHALVHYFFEEKKNLYGASKDDLAKGAKILEKYIPAEYIEEMRGIAEGSGVNYDLILFSNTFLDVVSANWVGVKPSCSNFAAFPGMTKDGAVVHGRNLEWTSDKEVAAMNTVFFITPKDGTPFVSLSWPGIAGTLTGMNASQITVGEMTSMSSEATLEGTPIMIQLRMLLEKSKTLDDAWRALADVPRTTGYNVLATDGKINSGFIAEMTSKHIVRIDPKDNFLMHTNHFVDKNLIKTQKKYQYIFERGKKSDTFYRYDRYLYLLNRDRGKIDSQAAISFLSDKFDPLTQSVSGSLDNTICSDSTLQSAVMMPKTGDIYVALKTTPAPDGGYVHLTLPVNKN